MAWGGAAGCDWYFLPLLSAYSQPVCSGQAVQLGLTLLQNTCKETKLACAVCDRPDHAVMYASGACQKLHKLGVLHANMQYAVHAVLCRHAAMLQQRTLVRFPGCS